MEVQELEQHQKEPTDGGKRKLELADQNPQEIAAPVAEAKRPKITINFSANNPPSFPVPSTAQSNQNPVSNKKITIPKSRAGLVVGKGGKTIKQIRLQSGADVHIANVHEADLHSGTRDVDVTITEEQISRAEELINAVISKAADAVSSTVHGFDVNQPEGKQVTVKVRVPNDKVGLLIGTGGETIKYMQRKSGANMKVFPLHLHPGDPSTERTLYINGTAKQIMAARELVKDVIHGKRILEPPVSGGFAQLQQLAQYGYAHSGNQPTDVSYYGQTWYGTGQMTDYCYYGQKPQMESAPFGPFYGCSQQAPNDTEIIIDQTDQQGPHGQPEGLVSYQSAELESAYPPFWHSLGAEPPASWQTESGYDRTVHWWEQTPLVPPVSTQATYEQAESQQSWKNGQSRSQQPSENGQSRSQQPSKKGHSQSQQPSRKGHSQSQHQSKKGYSQSQQPSRKGHSQSQQPSKKGHSRSRHTRPKT